MEKEYGYVQDINIKIHHFQAKSIDIGVNMIKEDIILTEAEIEFVNYPHLIGVGMSREGYGQLID